MNKANHDLRLLIAGLGLRQWQIARQCGVSPGTMCAWMRESLPPDKLARIQDAIDELTAEGKAVTVND